MTDIEYMTECMTKDLILLLMERRNMDLETALRTYVLIWLLKIYLYRTVCYSELEVENIIFTLYFTRFALSLSLT